MKQIIFVFVLLLNVATAFGQVKDQRALLDIGGRRLLGTQENGLR